MLKCPISEIWGYYVQYIRQSIVQRINSFLEKEVPISECTLIEKADDFVLQERETANKFVEHDHEIFKYWRWE